MAQHHEGAPEQVEPVEVIKVAEHAQRVSLSVDDRFAFTADQQEPRLAVIDTGTNRVSRWISLPGIGYDPHPPSTAHGCSSHCSR